MLTCHCTVAAGLSLAAAVNVTLPPALTDCEVGFVVTVGAKLTVNVAGLLVAVSAPSVNTASNCLPLSAAAVVKV